MCVGCQMPMGTIIPPSNLTDTRLTVTRVRLQEYWDQQSRVPIRPDQLPIHKNKDCSLVDGWGREMNWQSDGVGKVRVWSFGRDGKTGGVGNDADLEMVFDKSM